VHGTQHVEKQIITSFSYQKNLPSAAKELIPEDSVYMEAFGQLHFCCHVPVHSRTKVYDGVYLLGKPSTLMLTQSEMIVFANYDIRNSVIYSRMKINDIIVHTSSWNRGKKSNSAFAYYNRDHNKIEYGIVQKIVYTPHCNAVFLLVIQLKAHETNLTLGGRSIPHVHSFNPPSDVDILAIKSTDICSPCVFMSFSDVTDKIYISVLANLLEKD